MKKFLVAALLSLTSVSAFAAEVETAEVVQKKDGSYALSIDVRYGGGCKEHKFKLELGSCFETYPVQCSSELKDLTTDDYCEALISKTIEISFEEAGLNDSYFSQGSLSIKGDGDSKVSVELPAIN